MAEDSSQGDKTQEPTEQKIRQAREKGQFAKTKELYGLIVIFVGLGGLLWIGDIIGSRVLIYSQKIFQMTITGLNDPRDAIVNAFAFSVQFTWDILALPLLLLWLAVVVIGFAQNRFILPKEALKFDPNKVNPISGFKEKFLSLAPIVELVKSLLKLFLLGYVVWLGVREHVKEFPSMMYMDVSAIPPYVQEMAIIIFWRCIPIIVFVAILDFAYQYYDNHKKLMMSTQEIKEELKNTEGDPLLRARLRQRQREIAMSQTLANVPEADVVVTNPTHFAVALRYRKEEADAPLVVAKGLDLLALRMKGVADKHDIPIIENPPLARGLYFQTKEGQMIPPDFYAAVAEVLSIIYKRRKLRMRSPF